MEAIFGQVAMWVIGLAGGATMLENLLENYVMAHVPQWARGLVVPVISLGFAIYTGTTQGLGFWPSVTAALTLAGATTAIHNHPNLTSADLPPAPPTADGLPALTLPKS